MSVLGADAGFLEISCDTLAVATGPLHNELLEMTTLKKESTFNRSLQFCITHRIRGMNKLAQVALFKSSGRSYSVLSLSLICG